MTVTHMLVNPTHRRNDCDTHADIRTVTHTAVNTTHRCNDCDTHAGEHYTQTSGL